jgi:hypothetical protein
MADDGSLFCVRAKFAQQIFEKEFAKQCGAQSFE